MSAVISECGLYRYQLARGCESYPDKRVLFIGVNPSTADADTDDQTVRKWTGFTKHWGYGGFIVGNLFAYRATNVKDLATALDPIGEDNDRHLATLIEAADLIVPCWGASSKLPKRLRYRIDQVRKLLRESGKPVIVFGRALDGGPLHPLFLPYTTIMREWSP